MDIDMTGIESAIGQLDNSDIVQSLERLAIMYVMILSSIHGWKKVLPSLTLFIVFGQSLRGSSNHKFVAEIVSTAILIAVWNFVCWIGVILLIALKKKRSLDEALEGTSRPSL